MGATVGQVIGPAAASLGMTKREFLIALTDFIRPPGSGDSDPTKATIVAYEVLPKTRCGHKFASMVLDFLHTRRAEVPKRYRIKLTAACKACRLVLKQYRDLRFDQPARHNPASIHRVAKIAGLYVLFRRATRDNQLRQELLVLGMEDENTHDTQVTYLNPEVVGRGRWSLVRETVSAMTNGHRSNWRPDVINFHLLYEDADTFGAPVFLSGFAAGITSTAAEPAVVPVLAVRVMEIAKTQKLAINRIGDFGDSEIRYAWHIASKEQSPCARAIDKLLLGAMNPEKGALVRKPGDLSVPVLEIASAVEHIVPKSILDFCRTFNTTAAWRA